MLAFPTEAVVKAPATGPVSVNRHQPRATKSGAVKNCMVGSKQNGWTQRFLLTTTMAHMDPGKARSRTEGGAEGRPLAQRP